MTEGWHCYPKKTSFVSVATPIYFVGAKSNVKGAREGQIIQGTFCCGNMGSGRIKTHGNLGSAFSEILTSTIRASYHCFPAWKNLLDGFDFDLEVNAKTYTVEDSSSAGLSIFLGLLAIVRSLNGLDQSEQIAASGVVRLDGLVFKPRFLSGKLSAIKQFKGLNAVLLLTQPTLLTEIIDPRTLEINPSYLKKIE